jgi:D-alanine transaminase/branched-chain amino acid aminotransferase
MAIWLQPYVRERNADEVLYQRDGLVSECPRSNFFIVTRDGELATPAENILKGVIRGKVLQLARESYAVIQRPVTLDDIRDAREAFITSTTKHIIPVVQVDGRAVGDGGPGGITRQLRQALDGMVSSVTGLG